MAIPAVEGIPEFLGDGLDKLATRRPPGDPQLPVILCLGDGADGLVEGLKERLTNDERQKLAPLVLVKPDSVTAADHAGITGGLTSDIDLLAHIVRELSRSMPPGTGRLRLPRYWLVRDLLESTVDPDTDDQEHDTDTDDQKRIDIRDALYRRGRGLGRRSRWVKRLLEATADGNATGWERLLLPIAVLFPRWIFGLRLSRRSQFGWFSRYIAPHAGRRDLKFLDAAVRVDMSDDGLVRRLLASALLTDLSDAARTRRPSPARERRVTPFVVLLSHVESSASTYRLLGSIGAIADEAPTGTLLVVASLAPGVGVPDSLAGVGDDGRPAPVHALSLSEASRPLTDLVARGRDAAATPRVLLVKTPSEPVSPRAERRRRDHPKALPNPARHPNLKALAKAWPLPLLVAIVVVGLIIPPWGWPGIGVGSGRSPDSTIPPPACPGIYEREGSDERIGLSDGTEDCSFFPDAAPDSAEKQAVEQAIAAENAAVVAGGDAYDTIVYFAPITLPDTPEVLGQSAVGQLRGIALIQQRLNDQARVDQNKASVRVLIANPGDRFAEGESVAEQVGEAAEADPGIVGVVGIAQSRDESQEAIRVLAQHDLPVVAGPVTGDNMIQSSPFYYQASSRNERIARMLVEFVTHHRLVGPADGELGTARDAVVVLDHTDEYSLTLANDFIRSFRDAGHEVVRAFSYPVDDPGVDLTPETVDAPTVEVDSLDQMAGDVCQPIDPARDIVLYAGRSQQLAGLLDSMQNDPACSEPRTVVGGTDLTKLVQDPEVDLSSYHGLRLYHAAHAAPTVLRTNAAHRFVAAYTDAYGSEDIARYMSDAALAYDSLFTMQEAANLVFAGGLDPTSQLVANTLHNGRVAFDGVSGHIAVNGAADENRVPPNRPVLVMGVADGDSTPLLVCGRFSETDEATRWGPDDRFECPGDDD